MSRRLALACLLTVLALGLLPAIAHGRAQLNCGPITGSGHFDPIIFHDHEVPTGHKHSFFGNAHLPTMSNPNTADYSDLVGRATNCENPDDSAAYWIPELTYKATGEPVELFGVQPHVYYVSFDNNEVGEGAALPPDLRMVAGNHATDPTDPPPRHGQWDMQWGCGNHTDRPGPYSNIRAARCDLAEPADQARLQSVVRFPSCWSGELNPKDIQGNTADFSSSGGVVQQLAYHRSGACPDGYPVKLTKPRIVAIWDYRGNGTDVSLSCDPPDTTKPGLCMHADVWNTWLQTGGTWGGLEGVVANCVNEYNGPPERCGESTGWTRRARR